MELPNALFMIYDSRIETIFSGKEYESFSRGLWKICLENDMRPLKGAAGPLIVRFNKYQNKPRYNKFW
jgi:hypothetical protein